VFPPRDEVVHLLDVHAPAEPLELIRVLRATLADARKVIGFEEAPLLEKAREESVGRFWNTCQDFLHACSPELVAAEAEDIHQMRELTLRRRRDGLTTMWGLLSPDTAASVRAAIAPHARRRGPDDARPFRPAG